MPVRSWRGSAVTQEAAASRSASCYTSGGGKVEIAQVHAIARGSQGQCRVMCVLPALPMQLAGGMAGSRRGPNHTSGGRSFTGGRNLRSDRTENDLRAALVLA